MRVLFSNEEDLMHRLYLWPRAWDMWKLWQQDFTLCTAINSPKFRWISLLKQEGFTKFLMKFSVAWEIWKSRSQAIFKQVSLSSSMIMHKSETFLVLDEAAAAHHHTSTSTNKLYTPLNFLHDCCILIYVDGAFKNCKGPVGGFI